MATAAENFLTTYNNVAARLAEITASPKPSYTENGRTFNWTEYQRFLVDQMTTLKELLVSAEGPYELESRGVT